MSFFTVPFFTLLTDDGKHIEEHVEQTLEVSYVKGVKENNLFSEEQLKQLQHLQAQTLLQHCHHSIFCSVM